MTRQPLWVILCCLPEKGRKELEEIVEEMKERDREERGTGMKGKKQKKKKQTVPSTLTCYKDSKPCPTVSQYQLDAPVTQDTRHLRHTQPPPDHPQTICYIFWLLRGWSGGAKVLCILHHWGVQLILAYSWARPAILVVGKGRGGMFLVLLFLHFHSCSSFFPVPLFHLLYSLFYLFSPFLWETTQNDPQGLMCR